MLFGEFAALLTIWIVADCVPAAVGANVTLIEQLPLTPRLEQLLVSVKLLFTAPVTVTLEMVRGRVPVLVRPTVMGMDVVPTERKGKVTELAERVTAGEPAVPSSCRLPVSPVVRSVTVANSSMEPV
jgi:hypothetical protein